MSGLTAVSLFAGIGGFDLALERAGVEVAAAVEIDPACRSMLRRHFPQAAIFEDVTEVTGDQLRAAGFVPGRGIVCGGWPCQGNSVAGSRGGMADPRSGLWVHVVRLLAELRPRWFIGENVPGLLSVNGGRDIAVVRRDLAQLGYWWAERVLDAQHFGVPQRRRRVFFVGRPGDPRGPVEVLLEPEGGQGDHAAGGEARPGTAAATGGGTVATLQGGGRRGHRLDAEGAAGGHLVPVPSRQIAQSLTANYGKQPDNSDTSLGPTLVTVPVALRGRDQGSQVEVGSPADPAFTVRTPGGGSSYPMVAVGFAENQRGELVESAVSHQLTTGGGKPGQGFLADRQEALVRRLTPLECERLQGFPDGWTDGQADATRYRQLGNAVAVPVVEWIARRIVAVDASLVAAKEPAA